MNEQGNIEIIQQMYAAFARGDIATVLSFLDPQADFHFEASKTIPWAGIWRGTEGWTNFFQALGQAADEIKLDLTPFAAQGNNVVTAGRYQARVKSTGKRIDSPLVHLWTLHDGKVVRCLEMTNTAGEVAAFS